MRTTFDINENLIREAMNASKSKTKKGAIVIALKEYTRAKRRQELIDMIGNYEGFGLSLKNLKRMRCEE